MSRADGKGSSAGPLAHAPEGLRLALQAAFSKKAEHVILLDLRAKAAFTDYFVVCSGQNVRQVRAIVDAVEDALRKSGIKPLHVEGYDRAEWVLIDGFDFLVHVFTPDTREFYSLERLWGSAQPVTLSERDLG
jgi:ribosome-associated protein